MNEFNLRASTPLYDAMGISLSKLRCQLYKQEQSQVLVTVITDGEENCSKEYSGKMIKNLVNDLKSLGWVFAYIGANQNVDVAADSISINNRMLFEATSEGSEKMAKELNCCRMAFYNKISEKRFDDKIKLQDNFFDI
ncbi:MAG: hypothetical protein PHT93_12840 [Massilibacteroides sp.]|nr:hypothetical protein [Massilibacteroides sp.]